MSERDVIESCREKYYDDMVSDITHSYEDENEESEHDGDDWEYWVGRMVADMEKRGGK